MTNVVRKGSLMAGKFSIGGVGDARGGSRRREAARGGAGGAHTSVIESDLGKQSQYEYMRLIYETSVCPLCSS